MYEDIVKEVLGKEVSTADRRKHIKIEIQMNPIDDRGYGGDMIMDIQLRKLKMYLRPKVLVDISKFMSDGLKYLDESKRLTPPTKTTPL
jgi:hypothetical protein